MPRGLRAAPKQAGAARFVISDPIQRPDAAFWIQTGIRNEKHLSDVSQGRWQSAEAVFEL
jgi:hypothetical protein